MPLLSIKELSKAVKDGMLKAITIDTSKFEQYKFGFEFGLLKSLRQFGRTGITFLLSDIVLEEIKRHLISTATIERSHAINAIKPLSGSWGLTANQRDAALNTLFGEQSVETHTVNRINNFIEVTGAEILESAPLVDIHTLIELYKTPSPPFANREGKKNEFPDAITLLAIEKWAKTNELLILAVSNDSDWRSFCEQSQSICYLNDLGEALAVFQEDASVAEILIRENIAAGTLDGFNETINDCLNDELWKIEFDAEAYSDYRYDEEHTNTEIIDWHLQEVDGSPEIIVIEYNEGRLVAEMQLECEVVIDFSFAFEKWDGIDKDYFGMGSGSASPSATIEVTVLATFLFENGRLSIESTELEPNHYTIELGEIGPNWMYEHLEEDN